MNQEYKNTLQATRLHAYSNEDNCNKQLARMVKNIAEEITNGKEGTAHKWLEKNEIYSIEWITTQDHNYKACRLMVAGGGPNIYVNTQTEQVEGYWASDKFAWGFRDSINLDDYFSEEFEHSINKKAEWLTT
tara:strand:+ start:42 stop:437 length:396 start_codon:yes stop_codon:yes gene_type:complete